MSDTSKYSIEIVNKFASMVLTDGLDITGGELIVRDLSTSLNQTNGAIVCFGGMGINKDVNIGGHLTTVGSITSNHFTIDTGNSNTVDKFTVKGNGNLNFESNKFTSKFNEIILDGRNTSSKINIGTNTSHNVPIYLGTPSSTVTVYGDFNVIGSLTYIESIISRYTDKNIEMGYFTDPNNNNTTTYNDTTAIDGGIILKGQTDKSFIYKNTNTGPGASSKSNDYRVAPAWVSSENFDVTKGKHLRTDRVVSRDVDGLELFNNNENGLLVTNENDVVMKSGTGSLTFVHSNSGDWSIKNTTSDKDIIFNIKDNNNDTEVMRLVGADSVLRMKDDKKIEFRDTGLYINSSADGQLDIDADTTLQITAPTVDINASSEVNISEALKVKGPFTLGGDQNEFTISESSDNITFRNTINDKDIIFNINDNNNDTEVMRLVGADSVLRMKDDKKIEFRDTGLYINSSADGQLDIDADTTLQITAPTVDINASSEVNISEALKVKGPFTLGGDQNEFTISESSDNITFRNTINDKDIIFNINDNNNDTEVMRLVGADSALKINSNKKIIFGEAGEYISGDNTNLSIVSGGNIILSSASNVGIGTTGPDRRLDILDNTNPQLRLTHTDGTQGTDLQSDNNSLLTISPVGASTANAVKINSNHATSRLIMVGSGGSDLDIGVHSGSTGNAFFWNKNNASIEFGTNDTERMRIDKDGNFGIGVSDPDSKLEVYSTGTQQKWSYDADSFATMTVDNSSNTTLATGQSGNIVLDSNGDIELNANGGNVLIKDDTTQFMKFTNNSGDCVITNGAADKNIIFKDTGGNNILTINGTDESIVANKGTITSLYSNTLGVNGNVSGNEKLYVNGDARITGLLKVNGSITVVHTDSTTTEQISVTNDGTGPAFYAKQTGAQPIAKFDDENGTQVIIADDGLAGFGGVTSPSHQVDIQSSGTGGNAKIPLKVKQADESTCIMKIEGKAVSGSITNSLVVDSSAVTRAQIKGYMKVKIEDTGNQLADGDYYIPLYTLTT